MGRSAGGGRRRSYVGIAGEKGDGLWCGTISRLFQRPGIGSGGPQSLWGLRFLAVGDVDPEVATPCSQAGVPGGIRTATHPQNLQPKVYPGYETET